MDDMWKIAGAGIAFTLLAVYLKQLKEEYRIYLMLGASLYFGYCILGQITWLTDKIREMEQYFALDHAYLECILKMLGITCLGEFTADFCRDCGHEALSRQVCLIARITILGFSMPIVLAILQSVWQLI